MTKNTQLIQLFFHKAVLVVSQNKNSLPSMKTENIISAKEPKGLQQFGMRVTKAWFLLLRSIISFLCAITRGKWVKDKFLRFTHEAKM
eukprot:snap_masked-scaffold_2-processed-gene-25.27-mRNA-1 protein AED:1.00 eAED:1.00 QI:0/0/0/0/1/1/2/0/87